MAIRSQDIIVLLGAGASAQAGIPVSSEMICRVEQYLSSLENWMPFRDLYNHVKSAIYFSAGLKGYFNDGGPLSAAVPFNIETLVNTLYELERNEDHPLYPFIAAWNSRFVTLAGNGFSSVVGLRRLILSALKKWMCPEDETKADYYRGLMSLQGELNFPLHVFSLNYDLCVERLNHEDFRVETGFQAYGPDYPWNWQRFELADIPHNELPQLFLYKLHGSINWKRNPTTKDLFAVPQIQSVEENEMEIIFGRDFKLDAADPYLFFAYHFRRLSLASKLIVTIGYGFGDQHINKMLTQSLRSERERKLCVIQRCEEDGISKRVADIAKRLDLGDQQRNQVVVRPGTAKEFLATPGLAEELTEMISVPEGVPF